MLQENNDDIFSKDHDLPLTKLEEVTSPERPQTSQCSTLPQKMSVHDLLAEGSKVINNRAAIFCKSQEAFGKKAINIGSFRHSEAVQ